jgi:hypothetical protein
MTNHASRQTIWQARQFSVSSFSPFFRRNVPVRFRIHGLREFSFNRKVALVDTNELDLCVRFTQDEFM